MMNKDPQSLISLIIVTGFIAFIVYMAFFGLWPFNKKIGFFSLLSFLKETKKLNENIKLAIIKLPQHEKSTKIGFLRSLVYGRSSKKPDKSITSKESLQEDYYRNEFTKKYDEINEEFKKLKKYAFSHLWKEFTEQLIEPEPADTGEKRFYQNSIRPEKFFTLEYLLKKQNINLKLLDSMPGILIGLGVLGTFVGLSVSLFFASSDLTGSNLEGAIESLISGASIAFFTSVCGLFCSLLFNFISDKRISLLQNSLNNFNFSLERCLKFVTEEHLLTRLVYKQDKQLGDLLNELKQHGKYLENMDERIALKFGDFIGEFSQKQMENLDKTLHALQENIPILISRLENSQKENEEKNKELINYLAVISQDNQKQINQSLIEATQNIKSEFEVIIQNLRQGMDQTLSSSSGELRNLISSLGEMNQKILEQTDESKVIYQNQLEETAKKLHSFTDRLEKTISEVNNITSTNIKEALYSFYQVVEQQKQIVTENKLHIHSLDNLTDSLKPIPASLFEITKKFPELIEKTNNSNEYLKEVWGNYEKRFNDVDKSAEQIFIKIKEGLESIAKESAGYIENLNKQTAQVSHSFSQAVEELKETVEELNDYNKKVS